MNHHRENWGLRTKGARDWLYHSYYTTHGEAPSGNAFEDAVCQLEAKARFEGAEHVAHMRIAEHEGRIYLDLCDAEWRVVEIAPEDWRLIATSPVKFVRTPRMRPLPEPTRGREIDELKPFLNVQTENDFRLIVAYLLTALRPNTPYPVLVLNGEQGTAKSTMSRVIRSVVDPSGVPIRGVPREGRDLVAAARNEWMLCFDNLSGLAPWIADDICRLATGGGLGGRQLYTDYGEAVFEARRPVILNGIPDFATRGDLADRAIALRLAVISDSKRRSEDEFWADFEIARPGILGALLDGLACALRRRDEVEPIQLPRMADFAKWAMAAFPAFKWSEDDFQNAYEDNRAVAVQTTIEVQPVAVAICEFVEKEGDFEGTVTDLLSKLNGYAGEGSSSKYWPKDAARLGNALTRAAPAIRAIGIEVDRSRDAGVRTVTITKKG